MTEFPRITEAEKRKAVMMDLQGKSGVQIATHFNRTPATVTNWKRSKWWNELKEQYLHEIEDYQKIKCSEPNEVNYGH